MRSDDPRLGQVLRTGGLLRWWVADLYYGTERRAANVKLLNPRLQWDGDNQIQGRGSCTVVWQGAFADSITPKWVGDDYAPFGATLNIREIVQVGAARWEIPLGWFPIVDVPDGQDQKLPWQGRPITVGSRVELTLMDRMSELEPEFFDTPTGPTSLVSAMDEVVRLSRFQVVRTVPDKAITRAVVYEENRLDALYELCNVILDAVPYMTSDGALAFRPNKWEEPVLDLTYGPGGTVKSISGGMSADGVANYGIVRGQGDDTAPVLAKAWVPEGPLRVFTDQGNFAPARARKFALSSQYVTTSAQAQEWLNRELAQRSRLQAQNIEMVMGYDPRLEVWDVLRVTDSYEGTTRLCRIKAIELQPGTADMTVRVEVKRA